ncbi:MAG TPA: DUF2007 domain-containing protein [Bryobacteraceae bacterium]|jgi:hypothetical protein|nr:DUF2007 domain-containing protein [Bryobacteraceae bacterium]
MDELVTVFRSGDESAEEDAMAIAEILRDAGISPTVLDDDAPGVPEGVWEVRVAAADSARAEQLIAAEHMPEDEFSKPDKSASLDFETVYSTCDGGENEAEALTIKSLLESNGIEVVISGQNAQFPNLGWEVRVAREHAAEARNIIADAQAAGPSGAEEAEAETEREAPGR